jgi:hypothetical protein
MTYLPKRPLGRRLRAGAGIRCEPARGLRIYLPRRARAAATRRRGHPLRTCAGIRPRDALLCLTIAARLCDRGSVSRSRHDADKSAILGGRPAGALGRGLNGLLSREVLSGEATTVFENSTACAPMIENRSWCASRFDPSRERCRSKIGRRPVTAKSQVEKYPVMDGTTVYGSLPPMTAFCGVHGTASSRPFESKGSPPGSLNRALRALFTESLILAQDERWRRA